MQRGKTRISPDVYAALVADLAYSTIPTVIMGATLAGVALSAYTYIENSAFVLTAVLGTAAMLGKLCLMAWQRSLMIDGVLSFADAQRCQTVHLIATLFMAGSVAATATLLFLYPRVEWHVLATGLLFAYCSGVVGRLSVCPPLALSALIVAASPVVVASAIWNDAPHRMTSVIFCVFLVGSFETVRHVYKRAVQHIATELDMVTLARNDPLTGLLNRLGFRQAFRSLMTPHGRHIILCCIDLDGFKAVNDSYGHAAGDQVLVEVAQRIVESTPGAAVARLGGDEFAVFRGGMESENQSIALAWEIVSALRMPYSVNGVTVTIGASLGIAIATEDSADFVTMLQIADAASYRAKRCGGGVIMGLPTDLAAPVPSPKLRVVA